MKQADKIVATVPRDTLVLALSNVAAAQPDGEEGWTQIHFIGGGRVILTSISHSISIKYEFTASYEGEGLIKISGKQLMEYVKQLPSKDIILDIEVPERLLVRSGRSHAKFQLVQDQSYVDVEIPNVGSSISVKGEALARWVDTFKDFVLVDDNRYYATGALIWAEKNSTDNSYNLNAVASDSQRLAKSVINGEIDVSKVDETQVLVHRKTLEELKRVASLEPGKNINLYWHGDSLFFAVKTDNYHLVSRCIAGKYPPWEAAIPQNINISVELEVKQLSECLRRCLLFTDKSRILKFSFQESILKIQSFTPGIKEGEDEIELSEPVPFPFEVNYNGTFLLSVLSNLSGNKVNFLWDNASRPVKISAEAERSLDASYLLVPNRY